jgi:hypothetical protein
MKDWSKYNIESHKDGRLKVSRVAQGFGPDGLDEALFDLAANGRTEWTWAEWDLVLTDLDSSTLTINQWLDGREEIVK